MKFLTDIGRFIMPTLQKSAEELEVESQRREELGRAVERKFTYQSLQRHAGWQDFEKELAALKVAWINEMLREEDVKLTKAKIAALDVVLRISTDAVREGQNAQVELDGMNHE